MKYDSFIHHRRSIRLKEYDYRTGGCYFITVCTKNRESLFGNILKRTMKLNLYGKIADYTWCNLSNHNHHVQIDAYILMPDHLHGIIVIDPHGVNVGAGSEPAPTFTISTIFARNYHGLPEIIRQFKTFSARRINEIRRTPGIPVWQHRVTAVKSASGQRFCRKPAGVQNTCRSRPARRSNWHLPR